MLFVQIIFRVAVGLLVCDFLTGPEDTVAFCGVAATVSRPAAVFSKSVNVHHMYSAALQCL